MLSFLACMRERACGRVRFELFSINRFILTLFSIYFMCKKEKYLFINGCCCLLFLFVFWVEESLQMQFLDPCVQLKTYCEMFVKKIVSIQYTYTGKHTTVENTCIYSAINRLGKEIRKLRYHSRDVASPLCDSLHTIRLHTNRKMNR